MYMYPPAPTPDPSLESAEAPLSSLGKGPRKGRPAHNHVMVQELQLWNYTDIKNVSSWPWQRISVYRDFIRDE